MPSRIYAQLVPIRIRWVSLCIATNEMLAYETIHNTGADRQIKIEEAKANLEAEKLNAQAEVERAKGAAEAIAIENGAITPTYIQYLWVRQQSNVPDKVVYIPTEANLPILEAKK